MYGDLRIVSDGHFLLRDLDKLLLYMTFFKYVHMHT
jgi:hypothetical protein